MIRYYPGGRFKSQGFRDLDPNEVETLRTLAAAAPSSPPWTPERAAARDERDKFVIALYEDGVAASTIARVKAPSLGEQNIRRIIAARREEFGRGMRRLIPPTAPNSKPSPAPTCRPMDAEEESKLRMLDAAVPRSAAGQRDLRSPAGDLLEQYVQHLRENNISLDSIGTVMGCTREYVRIMLVRRAKRLARWQEESA